MTDTHGGARENSGRRNAAYEESTHDSAVLYAKSRAKEKAHKAKLAELQERKQKRELLDAAEVKKEVDAIGRMVKDTLTALPDRVASLLVGRSEAEIIAELRKEVESTLIGLSHDIGGK